MSKAPERDLSTNCQVCKKMFARKTRKGVYCSVVCRKKAFEQRRHDPGALLVQVKSEVKKKIEMFSNKEELYKDMDKLIMEWAQQLRALMSKGRRIVPDDPESVPDDSQETQ